MRRYSIQSHSAESFSNLSGYHRCDPSAYVLEPNTASDNPIVVATSRLSRITMLSCSRTLRRERVEGSLIRHMRRDVDCCGNPTWCRRINCRYGPTTQGFFNSALGCSYVRSCDCPCRPSSRRLATHQRADPSSVCWCCPLVLPA